MPAPAVIPAPIAYINAAAVKKLVVGSRAGLCTVASLVVVGPAHPDGGGTTPRITQSTLAGRNGSL